MEDLEISPDVKVETIYDEMMNDGRSE